MPWPRLKSSARWLVPAVLLAVTPKCVLCALAYAGLAAALGLGGPELCGAAAPSHWIPVLPGALAAAGFLLHTFARRPAPARS